MSMSIENNGGVEGSVSLNNTYHGQYANQYQHHQHHRHHRSLEQEAHYSKHNFINVEQPTCSISSNMNKYLVSSSSLSSALNTVCMGSLSASTSPSLSRSSSSTSSSPSPPINKDYSSTAAYILKDNRSKPPHTDSEHIPLHTDDCTSEANAHASGKFMPFMLPFKSTIISPSGISNQEIKSSYASNKSSHNSEYVKDGISPIKKPKTCKKSHIIYGAKSDSEIIKNAFTPESSLAQEATIAEATPSNEMSSSATSTTALANAAAKVFSSLSTASSNSSSPLIMPTMPATNAFIPALLSAFNIEHTLNSSSLFAGLPNFYIPNSCASALNSNNSIQNGMQKYDIGLLGSMLASFHQQQQHQQFYKQLIVNCQENSNGLFKPKHSIGSSSSTTSNKDTNSNLSLPFSSLNYSIVSN
jgi:hypothetical protein